MRQSLGTAVFFGMLGVTLFGLLFTPSFYTVVQWLVAKMSRARKSITGSTIPAVDGKKDA